VAGKPNEAVLVDFRKLVHLEFLLLNTIRQLQADDPGDTWNYSIVCGTENGDFVRSVVESIQHRYQVEIRILWKENVSNIQWLDYNLMFLSAEFWNQFEGEQLLMYQDDTIIFNDHAKIQDFLGKYDYCGAPWNLQTRGGNGGFSLRSKQAMLRVASLVTPTLFRQSPQNEDMLCCQRLQQDSSHPWRFPSPLMASFFSSELIYNYHCFAMHDFYHDSFLEEILRRVMYPLVLLAQQKNKIKE
jgi:hypothetical protein